ncbi:chemotaxis protein CheB [Amycolatopsis mediterranei]|uniref:chemotaxis protein CheB n=1 Tax=Amycolatopsis mediterranei TaxID=33910 RepID=UPI000AC27F9C
MVLSGAGHDGAASTHAVHEAGGLVLAHDEETAEHPWLPRGGRQGAGRRPRAAGGRPRSRPGAGSRR